MFEKARPVFYAHNARFADPKGTAVAAPVASEIVPTADVAPTEERIGNESGELRNIDWNELSARLNAARDLRRVLHKEASRNFASQTGGFAEAAARYFRTKDKGERGVNLVALGQGKGSSCMNAQRNQSHAVTGDAREV